MFSVLINLGDLLLLDIAFITRYRYLKSTEGNSLFFEEANIAVSLA